MILRDMKTQKYLLLLFATILVGILCFNGSKGIMHHDNDQLYNDTVLTYVDTSSITRIVGIAYNTLHRSDWNQFVIEPLLANELGYTSGSYNANDPRVIWQHGKWLAAAGVDYVLVDGSNNIDYLYGVTQNRPDFEMIEKTVPLILDIWDTIPNAPQLASLLGSPESADAFTDGRFQRKVEQVHEQFITNPKYKDQYFNY